MPEDLDSDGYIFISMDGAGLAESAGMGRKDLFNGAIFNHG